MKRNQSGAALLAVSMACGAVFAAETGTQTTKNNTGSITSGNAFNPAISVILDGNYYGDDVDGQGYGLLGEVDGISHAHGHGEDDHGHEEHSHGEVNEGFNLREAEIAITSTVDNYFDAATYLALSSDGSVDVEEAWFQTRTLPAGLRLKGGKFFSGIGYLNEQHPHSWDFVDQNLAYRNLLGDHGLQDTGLQLTWMPDWPTYTQFGIEALQGQQEKLGALVEEGEALDEKDPGPRLFTAFAKVSPELGFDHALQIGGWAARAGQHQEEHGEAGPGAEEPLHTLQGDASMFGLDMVYKYDNNSAYGQGDFKLQTEYLWQEKDLKLAHHETKPEVVGQQRKFVEDGLYVQGLYGIAPRWQLGLRYDTVGLTENKKQRSGTTLDEYGSSDRWTLAATWSPTEFSRLRLQYSQADLSIENESKDVGTWNLQWMMSLGSHGAHKF